jgi:hypothetical protein
MSAHVPDALAQLVAAIAEDNPLAPPDRIGELVVRELRRQGWHIGVPGACRPALVQQAVAPSSQAARP